MHEVVPFGEAFHLTDRPVAPQGVEVQPVGGVYEKVHSKAPEEASVQEDPGLFGEADFGFLFVNARVRGDRGEDVVHGEAAGAREDDDPVEDEPDVVPAEGESIGGGVVVGNAEELVRVVAGMGECEVDGE